MKCCFSKGRVIMLKLQKYQYGTGQYIITRLIDLVRYFYYNPLYQFIESSYTLFLSEILCM